MEAKNIHVGIYASVDNRHLTDDLLVQANQLWQQAEEAVADDPALLQRVKISRLSVDYAILERARPLYLARRPENAQYKALIAERFAPFSETLSKSKITRLHELQNFDKKTYLQRLAKDLSIQQ